MAPIMPIMMTKPTNRAQQEIAVLEQAKRNQRVVSTAFDCDEQQCGHDAAADKPQDDRRIPIVYVAAHEMTEMRHVVAAMVMMPRISMRAALQRGSDGEAKNKRTTRRLRLRNRTRGRRLNKQRFTCIIAIS